jgi:hypothetical protein
LVTYCRARKFFASFDEEGRAVNPETDLLLAEGVPCESLRSEVPME